MAVQRLGRQIQAAMQNVVTAMVRGQRGPRAAAPHRAACESVQELLDDSDESGDEPLPRRRTDAASAHRRVLARGMRSRQVVALAAWDSEDPGDSDDQAPPGRAAQAQHRQAGRREEEGSAQSERRAAEVSPEEGVARQAGAVCQSPPVPQKERPCKRAVQTGSEFTVDKELVLWLNSQSFPSALLCSGLADLRSGQTVFDCMSVFLHNVSPAGLTVAPSHPGPPAQRILVVLDALSSFFKDLQGMAAAERVKILVQIPVLREALLLDQCPAPVAAWWIDELLAWMVAVFRCIAQDESFVAASDRLARAAEAAAGLLQLEHGDSGAKQSLAKQQAAEPKHGMDPPAREVSWSRAGALLVAAPQATPPLRSLPKPADMPQVLASQNDGQAAWASRGQLPVAQAERAQAPSTGIQGASMQRPSAAQDMAAERKSARGGEGLRAKAACGGAAAAQRPVPGAGGNEAQRAPSPMHSGRPSAQAVTPKARSRSAPPGRQGLKMATGKAVADTQAGSAGRSKKHAWTKLSVAQLRLVEWLERMGLEFVKATALQGQEAGGFRRPKGVVEEDVIESLKDGYELGRMVSRLEGVALKALVPRHACATRAARVQNLERMLTLLRDTRRSMSSRWLWSAPQIADGDAAALWGLCADLHSEYGGPKKNEASVDWPAMEGSEALGASGKAGPRPAPPSAEVWSAQQQAVAAALSHAGSARLEAWSSSAASGVGSGLSSLGASPRGGALGPEILGDSTLGDVFDGMQRAAVAGDFKGGVSASVSASTTAATACLRAGPDGPDGSTRLWLQQLGVAIGAADGAGGGGKDDGGAQPLSSKDYPSLDRGLSLLDDPQRNGRLLWELAVAVTGAQLEQLETLTALREGRKPRKRPKNPTIFRIPYRQPKSVAEARHNMAGALGLVRGCGVALSAAVSHAGVVEAILEGNDNALWSLVGAIRAGAAEISMGSARGGQAAVGITCQERKAKPPSAAPSSRGWTQAGKTLGEGLGYSRRHVALLEVAVMQWMLTLPLLPDSLECLTRVVCMGDAPAAGTVIEGQVSWGKAVLSALLPDLAKGALLADVASAATGVQLHPTTRSVKTHKVALNNQVRLCEQLLDVKGLNHQALLPVQAVAEALAAGEHAPILGLLEDLMRCWFHVDVRKRFLDSKGRRVPFLGPYAPPPATSSTDVVAPFCLSSAPSCPTWDSKGVPYAVRVSSKARTKDAGEDKAGSSDSDAGSSWPHFTPKSGGGDDGDASPTVLASTISTCATDKENTARNGNRRVEPRRGGGGDAEQRLAMDQASGNTRAGARPPLGPPVMARSASEGKAETEESDVFRQLRRSRSLGLHAYKKGSGKADAPVPGVAPVAGEYPGRALENTKARGRQDASDDAACRRASSAHDDLDNVDEDACGDDADGPVMVSVPMVAAVSCSPPAPFAAD